MGQKLFQNILRSYLQAGGVDAGMAAHKLVAVYDIFIDQKLHLMTSIIHQSEQTDRTRCNI